MVKDSAPGSTRTFWWTVLAAFGAGLVVAGVFWRRQIRLLAARARPYVREQYRVRQPALIVNRWSGDGKAEKYGLVKAAEKLGVEVILLERGDDLKELAHNAISRGADAIGMAGGDGSLALVANVAVERGVPFFCIPVGTRNHFALDLGLDRDDPLSALEALTDGDLLAIDYGLVGDQLFLNNVSFGIYAQAVHREEYRENKESVMAEVIAAAAADPENQAAMSYVTPNGERHDRAPLLLVSNNPYVWTGPPDYGRRTRLDSGRLGIGAVTNLPKGHEIGGMNLSQLRSLHEWQASSYRIESEEPILAGVDGEALVFDSPLHLTVKRRGLRVLVPADTEPGYVRPGETVTAKLLDLTEIGGSP